MGGKNAVPKMMTESAAGAPTRKLWSRTEFARLFDMGFLGDGSYELIAGDIVRKMKNRPHVLALSRLGEWLVAVFGFAHLQLQDPTEIARDDQERNYVEPDVAVLRERVDSYTIAAPGPSDTILLIEVADSTRRTDLGVKADLYARAGYPEYWVLDVRRRELIVHRAPVDGAWTVKTTLRETDTAAALGRTETVAVSQLLP